MEKFKLATEKKYNGRLKIMPCLDLYDYNYDDDTIETFVEAFINGNLITQVSFKQEEIKKLSKKLNDEDFYSEVFADFFKEGYLITLETPTPSKIDMKDGKVTSFISYGFGMTTIFYIYLTDLCRLNEFVYRIEKDYQKQIYKKENAEILETN